MNRLMMMTVALVMTISGSTAWAGDLDKQIVPADAKVVMHLDFEAMLASEFGKLVVADLEQLGLKEKVEHMKQQLGLDPLVDFDSATIYTRTWDENEFVMLLRMNGNLEKLRELATLAKEYEQSEYNKHAVHSWLDNHKGKEVRKYCAEVGGRPDGQTLLVFGHSKGSVQGAVDLLEGQGSTLRRTGSEVLGTTPKPGCTVFIAVDNLQSVPEQMKQKKQHTPVLNVLNSLVVQMGEHEGESFVEVTGGAINEQKANQARVFLNGMLAMGAMHVNSNGGEAGPIFSALLQDVTIGGEGAEVTVRFTHDAKELHAKIKALHEMKTAGRHGWHHGEHGDHDEGDHASE